MIFKIVTAVLLLCVLYHTLVNTKPTPNDAETNERQALEDIQGDIKDKEKQKFLESMARSLVNTYSYIVKAAYEPGQSEYVGCFILSHPWGGKSNVRIDLGEKIEVITCISRCWEKRQRFALLWFGIDCWCFDIMRGLTTVADNHCSTSCKGNTRQACGGVSKGTVYYTAYIGCSYSTHYKQTCPNSAPQYRMSLPMCLDVCERNLFRFAGISWGNPILTSQNHLRCCCDHNLSKFSMTTSSDCPNYCKFDGKDFVCGGKRSLYFALYETGAKDIGKDIQSAITKEIWMEPNVNVSIVRLLNAGAVGG